jgi:hypothetical protein
MDKSSSHSHNVTVDSFIEHITKNDMLIVNPKKLKYVMLLLPAVFILSVFGIMMILIDISCGWFVLAVPLFLSVIFKFTVDSHRLILNFEGFTLKGRFGSASYKWVDIEEFRVRWSYFFKTIMFKYSDSAQSTSPVQAIVRKLSFNLYMFPDIYTMKAEDLAALMNKLREQAAHSEPARG